MKAINFDIREHVYRNDAFEELVKDAVRFFNGTPVHSLPPPQKFSGTGVYALYYTGKNPLYKHYGDLNRLAYDFPIYVGKAVPKGWRQARISHQVGSNSNELYNRLREHARSIALADGLDLNDFSSRFVIFESTGSDMIGTIEAALIKLNRPLWNSCIDGFGNHDPGKGRYQQAKSDWDTLHKGRVWADKLLGAEKNVDEIITRVDDHMRSLNKKR